MQVEQTFAAEQVLQGGEHNTQVLLESKSYPSLQLKQWVADPEHVLHSTLHL